MARSPRWCCRHRHDESWRHRRGSWELDDRLTAYDADHIEEFGLDGGKLLRIEDTCGRRNHKWWRHCRPNSRTANLNMIEPLPCVIDDAGQARLVIDGAAD